MALAQREKRFEQFCASIPHEKTSSLIAVLKPSAEALERLRLAAAVFVASCLPNQARARALIGDENALVAEFSKQFSQIKNVTPNGMIVPKRELILEYNLFARAFMDLIESLGIASKIEAWVNPPNLRFKDGLLDAKLLERNFASEHRHSEAWLPLNTKHCYSIFVPLFGDTSRNGVEFFTPPKDFDESWLEPIGSYKSGDEIARKFTKVDMAYRTGEIYLAEVATLHSTSRKQGSGPRISIDLNFIPKQTDLPPAVANMSKQEMLGGLGKARIFVFKDSLNEFADTQGASKHPTENRMLLELFK